MFVGFAKQNKILYLLHRGRAAAAASASDSKLDVSSASIAFCLALK